MVNTQIDKPVEYYAQYRTGETDRIIAETTMEMDGIYTLEGRVPDSFFMLLAAELSRNNVEKSSSQPLGLDNIEGGPFAAFIVQYENGLDGDGNGIGKPVIVGIGTNHVVPEHDSSAHGEMSAIRDAATRLGYSNLSGMKMFSSCECCPQCQAAVSGTGITSLVFANTRKDAADIGFSDEEQYEHIKDMSASMIAIDDSNRAGLAEKDILAQLKDHDAVILTGDGKVVAYGDIKRTANDPMASLPSMNAIRAACKINGNFDLPEDYILVTRNKPHPCAFITADWARIGRFRDPEDPTNPEKDKFKKNANKIIYLNDVFEEMTVTGVNQKQSIVATANDIIADLKVNSDVRQIVQTVRIGDAAENASGIIAREKSKDAFNIWKKITGIDARCRY